MNLSDEELLKLSKMERVNSAYEYHINKLRSREDSLYALLRNIDSVINNFYLCDPTGSQVLIECRDKLEIFAYRERQKGHIKINDLESSKAKDLDSLKVKE